MDDFDLHIPADICLARQTHIHTRRFAVARKGFQPNRFPLAARTQEFRAGPYSDEIAAAHGLATANRIYGEAAPQQYVEDGSRKVRLEGFWAAIDPNCGHRLFLSCRGDLIRQKYIIPEHLARVPVSVRIGLVCIAMTIDAVWGIDNDLLRIRSVAHDP